MHGKIVVVVAFTARIEAARTDCAARTAIEIFANGQLVPAGAAEYRGLIEFVRPPYFSLVPGDRLVAFNARIPPPAAFKLDRDDVQMA